MHKGVCLVTASEPLEHAPNRTARARARARAAVAAAAAAAARPATRGHFSVRCSVLYSLGGS